MGIYKREFSTTQTHLADWELCK